MSQVRPRPMPQKPIKPRIRGFRSNSTLAPMSEEKAAWRELYLKALAFQMSIDPYCKRCGCNPATEGHHPYGQIGAMIMIFACICRECHKDIHLNHNKARSEGWLLT